ncbi:hypothetical protein [Rhizobium sp. AP16]|uniref:hypothetical protein n=1 Tax=Rhizobium sp. AP16 TaxID=1144306 RepID=UPI00026ED244|nr:hypothetical protein [Rhizobium sp. AP16]EJK83529.1 hypothetical protein PMI03_03184 [Rhizobium sp. AP16]
MPRNGSGVYSLPPGSSFTPNTLIQSAVVNGINQDLATDLNVPRPVVAGGTGASSVAGAQTVLAIGRMQIGSEVALSGATNIGFTLPAAYRQFELILSQVNATAATVLYIQTSTTGGAPWDNGASDYTINNIGATGSTVSAGSVASNIASLTGTIVAASPRLSAHINIDVGGNGSWPTIFGTIVTRNSAAADVMTLCFNRRVSVTAITAFVLALSSGSFTSGYARLYGKP